MVPRSFPQNREPARKREYGGSLRSSETKEFGHTEGARAPVTEMLELRMAADGGCIWEDWETGRRFEFYFLSAKKPWCLFHHQSDTVLFV